MKISISFPVLVTVALTAAVGCGPRVAPTPELAPPPSHVGQPMSREEADRAAKKQKGQQGQQELASMTPGSGAAELGVGMSHACVRTTAGEVWCWGDGDSGQLGDGKRTRSAKVPRRVNLPQRAVRLSAGEPRCAILADATVACWGGWSKEYGAHNAVGIYILQGVTDAVFVTSNGSRRYVIRRDGSVLEIEGSKAPAVMPTLSGADEIVQSEAETCARMRGPLDKSVRCWRWEVPERKKKLPPGKATTAADREIVGPTPVASLAGTIALGEQCAVLGDRTVKCWGENSGAQIGDGTTIARPTPVTTVGITNATKVARGSYIGCAVLADGSAKCWGDSTEYPLIPGHPRRLYNTPVAIPLKGIAEIQISVGHACARLTDGRVACWGRNQFEEIGDASKEIERPDPSFVVGFGRPAPASDPTKPKPTPPAPPSAQGLTATDVAAGGQTTCARMSDRSARCWGKNDGGQLGDGTRDDKSRPVAIPYLKSVSSIRPGGWHTCAIAGPGGDDGAVFCWGTNTSGQLGQGNEDSHRVPVRVLGLAGIKQLSVANWACALLGDGTVKCWGDYDSGVGDPSPSGSKSPTLITGAVGMVEIATGGIGGCGRTAAGDVRCFGWGPLRELSGGRTPKRTAMPVRGLARAKSLSGNGGGFCAAVEGGNVLCWGSGDFVDVDHPTTPDGAWNVWVPVRAKGYDRALEISVGNESSCERNESRELVCWRDKKIERPGLRDVVKVTSGEAHTCALLGNGEVHCWGKNESGQLGDGTTTDRTAPVRVAF